MPEKRKPCCERLIRTVFPGYEPGELPLLYPRDIKKNIFDITSKPILFSIKCSKSNFTLRTTLYLLSPRNVWIIASVSYIT